MTQCVEVVRRGLLALGVILGLYFSSLVSAEVSHHTNADFTSVPINLTGNDVTPLVMMNVSRDHQLSYKAYNDYTDLDGNGTPETTYTDHVDYYGYFDSAKCYAYSTVDDRFQPIAMASGEHNHYCEGQWSGNFLNWATMTRMDIVRKMLYGGLRSTDTSELTVLERQYLPTDAHAFAKHYNGTDIEQLTPFAGIATTPPTAVSASTRTIPTSGAATRTFETSLPVTVGDQVKVFVTGNEADQWMIGGVSGTRTSPAEITLQIPAGSYDGYGTTSSAWTLHNLSQTGITIGNLTKGATSGDNRYSDTNTNPPLIRVAKGNFALWGANERWQMYWAHEKSDTMGNNGFRSNDNRAFFSGIHASAENPSQTFHGLGTGSAVGEYVARVEVVVAPSLLGMERYKQYGTSYKPVGLLQVYGDTEQIYFGMITGSYTKNISGGVLRNNISSFTEEVNSADGTFTDITGIVHNLNRLRLYGYDYKEGTYIGRDECGFQQIGFVRDGTGSSEMGHPANEGNCSTWGNPMTEMYLESLRYLAGKEPNQEFLYETGASKDATLGLTVASWSDPLDATNYCAALHVLNFNTSVSGYDGTHMGGVFDLGSPVTAQSLTDTVGICEGINESTWFIGSNGTTIDDLCTAKPIGAGFGSFTGLCPEAPTQKGTYLMAGIAHYANTHRIRNDIAVPLARENSRDLMVSTYGIALSTNVPKIEVRTDEGSLLVTILPAFRLASNARFGAGSLVDFKIIEQTSTYGKFYVNWEVSDMGGDHDQDLWGTIEYQVTGDEILITTNAVASSASRGQGFGYIISGTKNDGVHFHSGVNGFNFDDLTGVLGCSNCAVTDAPSFVSYDITGSPAGVLEDPLWYAAKYGGFIDSNNSQFPDQKGEWDAINNSDGRPEPDGIPDSYFFATNPLQLENSLNRVFLAILQRASSGTAAAVVSNNVSGVGALYQAYYEPFRQDADNNSVSWIGTVQALWLDDYGYLREDHNGDGVLDGYMTDQVIEQFYDEADNKTKVRRYVSTRDEEFAPYFLRGEVINYNAGTGQMEFRIEEISGALGAGPFSEWTVYNLTNGRTGSSSVSARIVDLGTTLALTVTPAASWMTVGDTIMMAHFASTVVALDEVKTIWNARQQLSFATADSTQQRIFSTKAEDVSGGGRHVKTWIDLDGDNQVDDGEFVDFTNEVIDGDVFRLFDVVTEDEAKDLIDYIRGKEFAGYRNRTIDYDGKGEQVIRLADIVNSTPTIVGAPQEKLDLLYKDTSYGAFRKHYAQRRQVLYVGSNGGMLHAFNGGFYDTATRAFRVNGQDHSGNSATEHPLGAEIWSYVPMNLLPHLKWLKDPDYTHVYYVDGKPKVFDAKIFTPDADHPGGWGTVLVAGMRFGGGPITVDIAGDGFAAGNNRELRSAYVIMDVTNPEAEPKLLAEVQIPDGSFTTSYPAVMTIKDKEAALDVNKWFLVFGSGPTNLVTAESDQDAMLYAFDLGEIAIPGISSSKDSPSGCERLSLGEENDDNAMQILSCETGVANSFVGDPITVDWELDYKTDSIYFGIVGGNDAADGRVMRLDTEGNGHWSSWIVPHTLIDVSQPVVSAVTPAIDNAGQKWMFFGTGRLFVSADQLSTTTQSIYGVKDTGEMVEKPDLVNVSDAEVQIDDGEIEPGSLHTEIEGQKTVNELEEYIADDENDKKGWYLNLPPIQEVTGDPPATRVINSSALTGGVLFTTAYQPGIDLCTGEGFSRLYGLYYKTGTAYPGPPILGTKTVHGKEIAVSHVELGHGFATTPSLHTGSGTGDKAVSVFTQLSTGAINRTEANTVESIRSGLESWIEPR